MGNTGLRKFRSKPIAEVPRIVTSQRVSILSGCAHNVPFDLLSICFLKYLKDSEIRRDYRISISMADAAPKIQQVLLLVWVHG